MQQKNEKVFQRGVSSTVSVGLAPTEFFKTGLGIYGPCKYLVHISIWILSTVFILAHSFQDTRKISLIKIKLQKLNY